MATNRRFLQKLVFKEVFGCEACMHCAQMAPKIGFVVALVYNIGIGVLLCERSQTLDFACMRERMMTTTDGSGCWLDRLALWWLFAVCLHDPGILKHINEVSS